VDQSNPGPAGAGKPAHPDRAMIEVWRAVAERGPAALALFPGREGELLVGWANQPMLDLLGSDLQDLLDQPLIVGSDTSWQSVVNTLALREQGGQDVGVLRRLDETSRDVLVDVVPLPAHEDDRPAGHRRWLVMLHPRQDAQTTTEVALAAAEQRLRALAEQAPVGIFVSEAGIRLGFVNQRFADLLGTDLHRLLGITWMQVIHRDDRTALLESLQKVLEGSPVDLTVRLVTGDENHRWLRFRFVPTLTAERAAGFIGTAEDVTERRAREERLAYQATHDPLTGLVNRRRLLDVLKDLMSGRRNHDRDFALLFLDIDGFKGINDRYGHEAGDRVLIEVARRLQRAAREYDVLARISGDEFVVVLRYVLEEEAENTAQRHLRALEMPFVVAGQNLTLTASMGIAMPGAAESPEDYLRVADRLMYAAKATGRGMYKIASPPPTVGDKHE
jgi:diguanylate cyclase (GGDEF)-like protein/PAS domain S-box-containing protein